MTLSYPASGRERQCGIYFRLPLSMFAPSHPGISRPSDFSIRRCNFPYHTFTSFM
ncbi:hypothetical protein M404DRAFT_999174, partial [Pisolithus tinctorius Marx 270]